MELPVDVVPGTKPPQFRWQRVVNTMAGDRSIAHDGTISVAMEDALVELVSLTKSLQTEVTRIRGLTYCAYCGHEENRDMDGKVIAQHIRVCPKHPMRVVEEQRDKLQAFKDWVHAYLDARDVPHSPPGVHGAEGCRIGDRMDWLMDELNKARQMNEGLMERVKKQSDLLTKRAEKPEQQSTTTNKRK